MKFSPDYVRIVLNENFEDAKAQFLTPLMAIEYAHLIMLAEQGIVGRDEAAAIRTALDAISEDDIRQVRYDGTYEDLFFYIERLVVAGCVWVCAANTASRYFSASGTSARRSATVASITARINCRCDIRYIVMSMSLRERAVCRRPAASSPQPATTSRSM